MNADTAAPDADAAVVWSAIAEPQDTAAGHLISALGHAGALAWLREAAEDPITSTVALGGDPHHVNRIVKALPRWMPRLGSADPVRLRERAAAVGARLVTRWDREWPPALDDLGDAVPHVLWVRGPANLATAWARSIAVVGARAATAYGEHVAAQIAAAGADRGVAVISGGAYGIDAAAHRGALAADGVTVAVLAGGVDQLYPAGNAALLERVLASGAAVSEQPPGFAPHRARFLSRNRLIATARATVVVEAARRSGALSTANHAAALARPLGAVPGPVTSASSAGCHALVREGKAVLLARADDALELALPLGDVEPDAGVGEGSDGEGFRTGAERQAYGAIPVRGAPAALIAMSAGLTPAEADRALTELAMRGLVAVSEGRWVRVPEAEPPDKSDIPLHMGGNS